MYACYFCIGRYTYAHFLRLWLCSVKWTDVRCLVSFQFELLSRSLKRIEDEHNFCTNLKQNILQFHLICTRRIDQESFLAKHWFYGHYLKFYSDCHVLFILIIYHGNVQGWKRDEFSSFDISNKHIYSWCQTCSSKLRCSAEFSFFNRWISCSFSTKIIIRECTMDFKCFTKFVLLMSLFLR